MKAMASVIVIVDRIGIERLAVAAAIAAAEERIVESADHSKTKEVVVIAVEAEVEVEVEAKEEAEEAEAVNHEIIL